MTGRLESAYQFNPDGSLDLENTDVSKIPGYNPQTHVLTGQGAGGFSAKELADAGIFLSREKTADDNFLAAAKGEEARYQEIYRPLNQELMARIGDNSIVDSTKKSLDLALGGNLQSRRNRNLGRYGVTQTKAQEVQNKTLDSLNNALTRTSTLADAQVKQYERDTMLRNELINLGRGISQSGMEGLNTAANNEAQRDAYNGQVKTQQSAQKMQFAGMGIGAAIAMSNPLFAVAGLAIPELFD